MSDYFVCNYLREYVLSQEGNSAKTRRLIEAFNLFPRIYCFSPVYITLQSRKTENNFNDLYKWVCIVESRVLKWLDAKIIVEYNEYTSDISFFFP